MKNRHANETPATDRLQPPPADGRGRIPNPHELLGVRDGETDPAVIVEAACVRLGVIRESAGSETAVKRFLVAQIIAAREEMLEALRRREAQDGARGSGRGDGGSRG
jgi:hypothetical protein